MEAAKIMVIFSKDFCGMEQTFLNTEKLHQVALQF